MSTLRVDSIQGQTAGTDRYVVQVVNQTTETAVNASGATVTSTGLSLSITPKSANNKILVMGSVNGVMTNAVNTGIRVSVHRGSASSDTKISNAQEYAAYDTASTQEHDRKLTYIDHNLMLSMFCAIIHLKFLPMNHLTLYILMTSYVLPKSLS